MDTTIDNGNDSQEVIYQSATDAVDANKTLSIGKWAESNEEYLDWLVCNSAGTPSNGCINGTVGQNAFKDSSNAYVQYTNYADTGSYVKTFTSASNDGDADKTYAIDLTYKVYNNAFKGKLDDIRVYRSSLSAADVTEIYEAANRSLELAFDEAPGQDIFADTSGNNYDGTCSSTSCPDSGIPGRANQAVRFDGGVADDDGNDGVADYITLEDTGALGLYDSSFTVLAWVKADDVSGTRSILGTTTQTTNQGLQLALVNGKPYLSFYNNSLMGESTIQAGQWVHLAWSYDYDTGEQEIFVNGVDDNPSTVEIGANPFVGTGTIYVGKSFNGNYFDGMIDHLVIVQEALSASDIQAIMNEAPVLNLHLDEDLDTTTFTDDSTDGNDATSLTETAEDATWFTDIFSPTTKTTGLTSDLTTINFDAGVTTIAATACDAYGHCTTETIDRCDYKIVTNANDSGDGSLRQAISDVCDGAYIGFDGDYNIYFDSSITIDDDLTLDGDTHNVTLSGDSHNDGIDDVHLFHNDGATVTLNNLTLTDGKAANDENYNGGLLVNDGTLALYNSILANGYADNNGGAIFNKPNAQLTISNTLVTGLSARLDGGGLYNDRGTVTVAQSTFLTNTASHGGGAANEQGTMTINNSTFAGNYGGSGGGIYNDSGGCIATLGQICGDRARVPGTGECRLVIRNVPSPAGRGTLASNLTYNLSGKELQ